MKKPAVVRSRRPPVGSGDLEHTTNTIGHVRGSELVDQLYEKDVKITDAQMHDLPISNHDALPQWNYTLSPRPD